MYYSYNATLNTPLFANIRSQKIFRKHDIQAKSDNKNLGEMAKKEFQLGFSSEIKVPQLGSARLGTFIARLGSSWKFPARAHH